MSLRTAAIRLAYENPSLRPHLLPLLAKQARGEKKLLMENDKVRVTWSDHPDNMLVVQELPSKPVKRRVRRRTYNTYYMVQWFSSPFLMENVLRDAKLSSSMDFDGVAKAVDAALVKAKDRAIAESVENTTKYPKEKYPHAMYRLFTEEEFSKVGFPGNVVTDTTVSFLEVEPANYKPVKFRGRDFAGTAEWGKFRFYADKDDDEFMAQVEGMQAFYESTSAGAARKLFQLLKADPDFCKGMTVDKFREFLTTNKVGFEYVPTVWR
jgi:hypothetical protein